MRLYIKQKVFSWRDKLFVKDEFGNDRYYAQGEIFSWGRKLHLYYADGQEVALIRQKVFSFLTRYYIDVGGYTYTLVKEFTFLKPRLHIEGIQWRVEGDFWAHDYSLCDQYGMVMRISKRWFTWGDAYDLDIPNPANELMSLCVALAIDCIQADSAAAAAASS